MRGRNSENGIVGFSQGARFVEGSCSHARQGGSDLCEKLPILCPELLIPRIPSGPKEDIMKPASIALLITAVAQLITAFAAAVGAIRCGP